MGFLCTEYNCRLSGVALCIICALLFLISFTPAAAAVYLPGSTLNPDCLPTDADCGVIPPATFNPDGTFSIGTPVADTAFSVATGTPYLVWIGDSSPFFTIAQSSDATFQHSLQVLGTTTTGYLASSGGAALGTASVTTLSIDSLNGFLFATDGVVTATTSLPLSATTDELAEGFNHLYWTEVRSDQNFASNFTDMDSGDLAEGTANLYFTPQRAHSAIGENALGLAYSTSTGVITLESGYTIPTTASTTDWQAAFVWGNHVAGGYLIGTQNLSEIGDAAAARDNLGLGAVATLDGIDISSATNLFVAAEGLVQNGDDIALASGYSIPESASTTAWQTFYAIPSSRISAGAGLAWEGATLSAEVVADDLGNYLSLAAWDATNTNALAEGANNLYFTNARADARADSRIAATTSVPHLSVGTSSVALTAQLLAGFDQTDYLELTDWFATTTDALNEGSSNTYYTDGRVSSFITGYSLVPKTNTVNTFTDTNTFTNTFVLSELSDTLLFANGSGHVIEAGVAGPLLFSGGTLSIAQSNASQDGYLSAEDWETFNGKVSFENIDTSAELADILTNETGSAGSLVFSTSPAFFGTATFVNTSNSGSLSVGNSVTLSGLPTGGGNAVCVNGGTGAVSRNAATTCLLSSARFKHDIQSLNAGLASVLQLKPVSYQYTDQISIEGEQVGLIAEDVAAVDSRLVVYDESGQPYTVRYENLGALLANAIQEQQVYFAGVTGTTSAAFLNPESTALVFATAEALQKADRAQTVGVRDLLLERISEGVQVVRELVAERMTALRGEFEIVSAKQLCVEDDSLGETCLDKETVDALLEFLNEQTKAREQNTDARAPSEIPVIPAREPEPEASQEYATASTTPKHETGNAAISAVAEEPSAKQKPELSSTSTAAIPTTDSAGDVLP